MEYLDQIKALAEKGVDKNPETTLGFHGTSIEAIKYLAEHGRMPSAGTEGKDFYFCPVATYDKAYEEAVRYAEINAIRNKLIALLHANNVKLTREFIEEIFGLAECGYAFEGDEYWFVAKRIMKYLNIKSWHHFDNLYSQFIREYGGLVLGIDASIQNLSMKPGDPEELVVVVPQGLPIQYINGIEPMSKCELDAIFEHNLKNVELLY